MFCHESLFWTFLFSLKILYTATKIFCHQNFKKIYLLLNIGIDLIISWPQKTWKKCSIKSIIKSRLTFFFRMTSGKAEHFLNWICFFSFFFKFFATLIFCQWSKSYKNCVLQNHNANMVILLLILESYYVYHIIRRISKS